MRSDGCRYRAPVHAPSLSDQWVWDPFSLHGIILTLLKLKHITLFSHQLGFNAKNIASLRINLLESLLTSRRLCFPNKLLSKSMLKNSIIPGLYVIKRPSNFHVICLKFKTCKCDLFLSHIQIPNIELTISRISIFAEI